MSVEFVPGEEPTTDATVDALDESAAHRPRRRRWWVIAAVVVVAAIGWAITRPAVDSSRPQPHPSKQPLASAHFVAPMPVAVIAPECRGLPDCSVQLQVPAAIRRLVHAYLPAVKRMHVRTVIEVDSLTHRDLLVARDIRAGVDSSSVVIRVQRGGPTMRAIVPDPPGFGSLLIHRINSGFVVRLQYLAPDTVPPRLDRLRALIGDRRLATA